MKFNYILNKELPRLAWCAIIVKDAHELNLYHGIGIETERDFFVEGAWNGEFFEADFDKASFFMGSGGKKSSLGTGFLFSTPSHTLERLYSLNVDDIIYVSNSMPFLLYMSENNLRTDYLDYESDLIRYLRVLINMKKT